MREASQPQASKRLRPHDRVKKRSEYRIVQLRGRRVHTRHFLIVMHPSLRQVEQGRIGITVTKKIGNAVARNRVKRVVREVYRRNRRLFPRGYDVVLIAKRGASDLNYSAAVDEVERATNTKRFAEACAGDEASA